MLPMTRPIRPAIPARSMDRIASIGRRWADSIGSSIPSSEFSATLGLRGEIPGEHYYRVERTLKAGEGEQRRRPEGEMRTYMGIPVFEGHYPYRGMRIVPSWAAACSKA